MIRWRYRISLRMLKNIATWEEKFLIPRQSCRVLFIMVNTTEIQTYFILILFCSPNLKTTREKVQFLLCNHSNSHFFLCVKITCYFHTWRCHVFRWKLAWCFIGVYEISRNLPLHEVIAHIQDILERTRDTKQNITVITWPELLSGPFRVNHLTIAFFFLISWTLAFIKMWQICPKMNIFHF